MTYFAGYSDPTQHFFSTYDLRVVQGDKSNDMLKVTRVEGDEVPEFQEGDLYFSRQTGADQRYAVPVLAGEHGFTADTILMVSHQYKNGKWKKYEKGWSNMVIRVHDGTDFDAHRAIESALYNTRLGNIVGHDVLREMTDAIAKVFGLRSWSDEDFGNHVLNTDDSGRLAARQALIDLLRYRPEGRYSHALGEMGAAYDDVGFAQDADEYTKMLNGESDGFKGEGDGKGATLMSQAVMYAVVGGKHNGRSIKSRIEALKETLGVDDRDIYGEDDE